MYNSNLQLFKPISTGVLKPDFTRFNQIFTRLIKIKDGFSKGRFEFE